MGQSAFQRSRMTCCSGRGTAAPRRKNSLLRTQIAYFGRTLLSAVAALHQLRYTGYKALGECRGLTGRTGRHIPRRRVLDRRGIISALGRKMYLCVACAVNPMTALVIRLNEFLDYLITQRLLKSSGVPTGAYVFRASIRVWHCAQS